MTLRSQRPFHGRREEESDEPVVPLTEPPPTRRRLLGYGATLLGVFVLSTALHVRSTFGHEGGGTALTSALFAGSAGLFLVGFRSLRDVPAAKARGREEDAESLGSRSPLGRGAFVGEHHAPS